MAETLEITGKTVEEALRSAARKLNTSTDQLSYVVLETPSKGFLGLIGKKDAKIRVTVKADKTEEKLVEECRICPKEEKSEPAEKAAEPVSASVSVSTSTSTSADGSSPEEKAESFLKEIFSAMGIQVEMEKKKSDGAVQFSFKGARLGVLIGKHGATLDSLQYLTNLAANRGIESNADKVRIVLDVENYRSRREDTLRHLAKKLADRVNRTGNKITLEPMNRHERKIIHLTLQDDDRVITFSSGEEPFRKVIIETKSRSSKY